MQEFVPEEPLNFQDIKNHGDKGARYKEEDVQGSVEPPIAPEGMTIQDYGMFDLSKGD